MSEPLADRREQILGELAEWMHAGAREAQQRLMQAESTEEFVALTGALSKLARGVRQSILMQAKLESGRLAAEAKAEREAAPSEFVPRHIKRVRIRAAIGRHVWEELEDDGEVEVFWADLNARLDELEGSDDFLEVPIDDLIARLCHDLGYEPPPPRPPFPGPRAASPEAPAAGEEAATPAPGPGRILHAPDSS